MPSPRSDPASLERRPSWYSDVFFPPVSMHAKCVVVDRHTALVGSANFTERAQTKNLEVGVALRDPEFADALLDQWGAAIAEGLVRRVGG